MESEQRFKPWGIYIRDGKPCQVITVACDAITGESMVVYQQLYGEYRTYVKPLSMFVREIGEGNTASSAMATGAKSDGSVAGEVKPTERENAPAAATGTFIMADAPKVTSVVAEEAAGKTSLEESFQASKLNAQAIAQEVESGSEESGINPILMAFLDAETFNEKLTVITSNMKSLDDRLINNMAVSLDCSVKEGPIDERIQELIYCLKTMTRFEDRRIR